MLGIPILPSNANRNHWCEMTTYVASYHFCIPEFKQLGTLMAVGHLLGLFVIFQ